MKALIKAGRTLLGLSQVQLCEIAAVPLITLRRIEGKPDHAGLVSEETVLRVIAALQKQGIQFLDGGQIAKGPGVAFVPESVDGEAEILKMASHTPHLR